MKLAWLLWCGTGMAVATVACGGDDAAEEDHGGTADGTTTGTTQTDVTGTDLSTSSDSLTVTSQDMMGETTEDLPGDDTTTGGDDPETQEEATTRDDPTDGTPNDDPCAFEVEHELSPEIFTVGIVTWSTALEDLDAATIEFGPDTDYGMEAPVDLDEPEFRTLLLGMRPNTEYHFRIVAHAGDETCRSEDYTLTTGPQPNGLPGVNRVAELEDAVTPGFIVTDNYTTGHALVYDHEGVLVWWYATPFSMVSRANLSFDGKHMIIRNANPAGTNRGESLRVTLDGLESEVIDLPRGHHDFTVTPDNGIVFIVGSSDNCDELVKVDEDGKSTVLYRIADAFDDAAVARDGCHTNSVHYDVEDDTFTFSVLHQNAYVKIGSDGELLWVLGGEGSHFSGDGAEWDRQHGHQMLAPDRILFFNNAGLPDGPRTSLILEVQLDLTEMTAERFVSYAPNPSLDSPILGDVQALPSGNLLVTYSTQGTIHEVSPEGELVQTLRTDLGGAWGYATHRPTLYGPPPEQR